MHWISVRFYEMGDSRSIFAGWKQTSLTRRSQNYLQHLSTSQYVYVVLDVLCLLYGLYMYYMYSMNYMKYTTICTICTICILCTICTICMYYTVTNSKRNWIQCQGNVGVLNMYTYSNDDSTARFIKPYRDPVYKCT